MTLSFRVEAATGPDRELDAEIAVAIQAKPIDNPGWLKRWKGAVVGGSIFQVGWVGILRDDGRFEIRWPVAAYTASIDAADSVTPSNFVRRISQIRFGMWLVELWNGDKSFRTPCDVESAGCTEPLARLAAALKARGL